MGTYARTNFQPSKKQNNTLLHNINNSTTSVKDCNITNRIKNILQDSKDNISPGKRQSHALVNSNELETKKRKLTDILTELKDKKVALPVLLNILKNNALKTSSVQSSGKSQRNIASHHDIGLLTEHSKARTVGEATQESVKKTTPNNIKIAPITLSSDKCNMGMQPSPSLPSSKYISYYDICKQVQHDVITVA